MISLIVTSHAKANSPVFPHGQQPQRRTEMRRTKFKVVTVDGVRRTVWALLSPDMHTAAYMMDYLQHELRNQGVRKSRVASFAIDYDAIDRRG